MYQDESEVVNQPPDQANQEADDQVVVPGPTVFERRAPTDMDAGTTDPVAAPPAAPAGNASPAPAQPAASQPPQPQEPSVLVFRDGHRLEVQNYAIVGDTLYDFTPGHAYKVPLSQLDVPATVKANDDRGVDFTVPASSGGE